MPSKPAKPISLNELDAVRFQSCIKESTPNECWLWQGPKNKDGYGIFNLRKNKFLAHRVSAFLSKGSIPESSLVCHSCDTPACCNPEHLWFGKVLDNIRDRVAKGRTPSGGRHHLVKHPELALKGEANGCSKLSEQDVTAIRYKYSLGFLSQIKIAEEYKISHTHVSKIVRREIWTHVA